MALILICGVVGYMGFRSCAPVIKESFEEAAESGKRKSEQRAKIEVSNANASKSALGIVTSSFSITNHGDVAAKDFHLEMHTFGSSGTRLNRLQTTLYEVVKAGETRSFQSVNFGTADPQSANMDTPHIFECTFIAAP